MTYLDLLLIKIEKTKTAGHLGFQGCRDWLMATKSFFFIYSLIQYIFKTI